MLTDSIIACKLRVLTALLLLELENLNLLELLIMHILHLLNVLHLEILHMDCIFHCFVFKNQLLNVHLTALRGVLRIAMLATS